VAGRPFDYLEFPEYLEDLYSDKFDKIFKKNMVLFVE
jgi:hypothetical protein